ncbi:hypothetical protein [Algibacter mikhailovii]|uniref:Uncharacterized protein n=1 Tax=Algibacter mikhailovii TaxID=425498 RepID=A0A918R612_9FLAO|nr:hypothetical protein [Algibacter mikhailovii]GGZ87109.1 hypothetical protein GCM10007028_26570 [Algibacter mikhailovii]
MKVGIWLDKKEAFLVTLGNKEISEKTIMSNIENYRIHGGSGTRFKGGPQDVVQDSKYLEREKHQFRKYFETIISEIKEAQAIVLFGPAETCLKLNRFIIDKHKELSDKVQDVVKMDSMTKPQAKARIKAFFKEKSL